MLPNVRQHTIDVPSLRGALGSAPLWSSTAVWPVCPVWMAAFLMPDDLQPGAILLNEQYVSLQGQSFALLVLQQYLFHIAQPNSFYP